ncbi:MAG TPA: hypothetical protein VJ828_10825 [Lacipirellulaceae bacterium]|nr:hypothetical protein [Lacipirellulaceae bacterium]
MTQAVQKLLATFDSLTKEEQHVAAIEVLRRAKPGESDALTDEALVELADALFVELDRREEADAQS